MPSKDYIRLENAFLFHTLFGEKSSFLVFALKMSKLRPTWPNIPMHTLYFRFSFHRLCSVNIRLLYPARLSEHANQVTATLYIMKKKTVRCNSSSQSLLKWFIPQCSEPTKKITTVKTKLEVIMYHVVKQMGQRYFVTKIFSLQQLPSEMLNSFSNCPLFFFYHKLISRDY